MAETPELEPNTPEAPIEPPAAIDDVIVPPVAPEPPAVPSWTAPAPASWTPTQVPGTGTSPDTVVPNSAPPANPYVPANPYAPPARVTPAAPVANPYAPPPAANGYTPAPPVANPYAPPPAANPYAVAAPGANPYAPAGPYGQAAPVRPNPYAPAQGVSVGSGYGQAPPTYPGYAPAYGGYPMAAAPPKGLSLTSMILGISGLFVGFILGGLPSIAALITGIIARKREPAARAFWLTGIITGAVGIGFGLLIVIIYIVAFAAAMNESSYY